MGLYTGNLKLFRNDRPTPLLKKSTSSCTRLATEAPDAGFVVNPGLRIVQLDAFDTAAPIPGHQPCLAICNLPLLPI